MANGPQMILSYLVRTGMWSIQDRLSQFKHIILDVDSIVTSLFRLCVSNHINRQRSIIGKNQQIDLHSTTLINYTEFSRYVTLLFDFFKEHQIEPFLVYEGKFMEAPIFGLLAAEFTKNTQQVVARLSAIEANDKHIIPTDPVSHLPRPNLALTIFKSIVNERRRTSKEIIRVRQAFYSAYPMMAKLARDFNCPVLTDNCDFILMDVRAGLVLFEDFWRHHVEMHDLITNNRSKSLSNGKSPKSRIKSSPKSADTHTHLKCRFHLNSLFLRQHPGLSTSTSLHLFPLTSVDFVIKYAASLKRLQIYDREYTQKDFMHIEATGNKEAHLQHHKNANRLEMALSFLTSKTLDIVTSQIRSEATRTKSSFDDDYRQLFNYYAVAYEFQQRLRFTLKYIMDPAQLRYIEECLVQRECTAEWLLVLLCCSIGHLAGVGYNRHIQFEDLATKHSAHSIINGIKSMFMSLFSENKSHKSEHSISLSKKQQDTITRYATASLTQIDREHSKVVEQTVSTICENKTVDQFRGRFQFSELARHKLGKESGVHFINLAFKTENILKLSGKLKPLVAKHVGDEHNKEELAIMLSLVQFAAESVSSRDDKHAKQVYQHLFHHLELALLNIYLYNTQVHTKGASEGLATLVNLVKKQDFENVCASGFEGGAAPQEAGSREHLRKKSKQSPSSKAPSGAQGGTLRKVSTETSKQIRHLIELLHAAIESYYELNAFFEYPLPKLSLQTNYNPILLYNLTLYSINHPNNKILIWPK